MDILFYNVCFKCCAAYEFAAVKKKREINNDTVATPTHMLSLCKVKIGETRSYSLYSLPVATAMSPLWRHRGRVKPVKP